MNQHTHLMKLEILKLLPTDHFEGFSKTLPCEADTYIHCQHLDDDGNRCPNPATDMYTHHGDPTIYGGWYAVYCCREHLAELMSGPEVR